MHIKAFNYGSGSLGKHLFDVLGRALTEAAGCEVLSSEDRLREDRGEERLLERVLILFS